MTEALLDKTCWRSSRSGVNTTHARTSFARASLITCLKFLSTTTSSHLHRLGFKRCPKSLPLQMETRRLRLLWTLQSCNTRSTFFVFYWEPLTRQVRSISHSLKYSLNSSNSPFSLMTSTYFFMQQVRWEHSFDSHQTKSKRWGLQKRFWNLQERCLSLRQMKLLLSFLGISSSRSFRISLQTLIQTYLWES